MHVSSMKHTILATFRALAAEKGLQATSLADLAAACGITKATIFAHYPNRTALEDELFRTMESGREPFTLSLEGDAAKVLGAAGAHWISFFTQEPVDQSWRIVQGEKWHDARALAVANAWHAMLEAQVSLVLETLSESGRLDIAEPDLACAMLVGILTSCIDQENLTGTNEEDWKIERALRKFVRLYRP